MFILGLGGSDHDVSSALLEEGRIVCAIEEERVSRKKYGFNSNLLLGLSRKYVLQSRGIKLEDVELIVADDILVKTALFPIKERLHLINHHLLHAASAFYPSEFDEAAILVVDNAGSFVNFNGREGIETLTYARGSGNDIEVLDKIIGTKYKQAQLATQGKQSYQTGDPDNSLGYFYKIISHFCGFNFLVNGAYYFTEDGKTMGLAPYGSDRYYQKLRALVHFEEQGQISIDLNSGNIMEVLEDFTKEKLSGDANFTRQADLAWAGQQILEEALLHTANHLYNITKLPYLCIAGGVGLNSVANGKILKKTPFKKIFVQPASGDNGTSIGAALWGYYGIQKQKRIPGKHYIMNHAYLGKTYTDAELAGSLARYTGLTFTQPGDLLQQAALLLRDGKIISWFQGGAEFGPRALGHRSILANPILPSMKDHLNQRVKFREMFRPFAPAVLYEHQEEFFEIAQYTPFMLIVIGVRPEKRHLIPAVTHIDGTARLQSVTKENCGMFHSLINEFYRLTGVPVLLNTSYNIKGEPIVETPDDAVKCFLGTGIDYLILGPYMVSKKI